MSKVEQCNVCKFYDGSEWSGDCRRHTPVIRNPSEHIRVNVFPEVRGEDYCGDFKRVMVK
jgi:hypothetical protein